MILMRGSQNMLSVISEMYLILILLKYIFNFFALPPTQTPQKCNKKAQLAFYACPLTVQSDHFRVEHKNKKQIKQPKKQTSTRNVAKEEHT